MAPNDQPARAPLPSRIGRYEILGLLGQGGMARVYLALQRGAFASQKLVVIKQLRAELVSDEAFRTMFMDEARIALQLHHPNVVHTYEVGSEEDDYFLAMEFLEGMTLAQIIRKAGRAALPLHLHIWILSQVLAGLAHAHELRALDGDPMGIVHRDVTPSNVMITSAGEVKLLDFGIAKVTGALSSTQHGMIKGKLGYIAPEQWMGRPSDARADLFAVAVMLWEAIAGRRRSVAETSAAAIDARIHDREPAIEDVVPDVPQSLAAICRRGLAHDPAARYASAAEFRADLDDFLDSSYPRVGASMVAAQIMQLFSDEFTALRSRIERYVQEHRPPRTSDRASTLRDSEPVTYLAGASAKPSRARWIGGIVAGVAAASGLALALSRTFAPLAPTLQAASGVHAAQVATAVAASAPAVAASAPAPLVRVSVVAYPKHAQLLLDGRRIPNPFAQELAADTGPHRLEASADGYQPSSQVVSLERDVELVLELRKLAVSRRTRGVVATPTPTATQAPQRADATQKPVTAQPTRGADPTPLPGQDLSGPSRTPRSIDERDLYQ